MLTEQPTDKAIICALKRLGSQQQVVLSDEHVKAAIANLSYADMLRIVTKVMRTKA